jgi:DNA-binding response OmpR family regulator
VSFSSTAQPKILLVDDDHDLVQTVGLACRKAGLTPVLAFNRAAAIEQFECEAPDIAVLDIELGAWSGLDLLDELRKRSEMPILIVSGCASDEIVTRSFELGADGYLQKPIGISSLIARIRAVLARHWRAREQTEAHIQLNVALRELVQARDQALAAAHQAALSREEGLALAAHDLLEPLTIISSVAQLQHRRCLKSGTPATEPVVQALAHIEANAAKMAQQLMDLLGSTRLEIDHVLGLRLSHHADPKSPPLSAA